MKPYGKQERLRIGCSCCNTKKISKKQTRKNAKQEIVNLADVSLDDIYREISRREKKNPLLKYEKDFSQIKSLNFHGITTEKCEVVYDMINGYKGNPNFSFYYNGEDFYYGDTGMSREEWTQLIPSIFAESMENVYEISYHMFKGTPEEKLKFGLDILKKCGYVNFRENKERY